MVAGRLNASTSSNDSRMMSSASSMVLPACKKRAIENFSCRSFNASSARVRRSSRRESSGENSGVVVECRRAWDPTTNLCDRREARRSFKLCMSMAIFGCSVQQSQRSIIFGCSVQQSLKCIIFGCSVQQSQRSIRVRQSCCFLPLFCFLSL